MPGFDSPSPAGSQEPTPARNTRLGLILFCLYLAIYTIFVILNALWPEALDAVPLGGVNLGIVYGFGLIGLAFLLALVYSWLCRR